MSDAKQFALDLTKLVKTYKERADLVVRKIVLDMGTRIIMRSPVGDGAYWQHPPPKGYTGGHFRANWQYGESTIPPGIVADFDKSGNATIQKLISAVKPGAAGKVLYLTNNLPYAQRLEQGWSYRQAPAGVVGVTLVEFQDVVTNAVRAYNP